MNPEKTLGKNLKNKKAPLLPVRGQAPTILLTITRTKIMETNNKKQIETGGLAFPAWDMSFNENPNLHLYSAGTSHGMTLRDYFAAKALPGVLENYHLSEEAVHQVAKDAYMIADAMIQARKEAGNE